MIPATLLAAIFAALVAALTNHDPVVLGLWTGAALMSGWKLREELA